MVGGLLPLLRLRQQGATWRHVLQSNHSVASRWGHVTADTGEGLHTHVPLFKDSMDSSSVVLSALGEWLADSIFDEQEPAGVLSSLLKQM